VLEPSINIIILSPITVNMSYHFKFDELSLADLVVDAIYEGGKKGNATDDPLSRLLKGVGNQGGFRPKSSKAGITPYVVLYTDLNQPVVNLQ